VSDERRIRAPPNCNVAQNWLIRARPHSPDR